MKQNRKNYTLKVLKKGKQIDNRVQTHSLRRFTAHLRTINWQNSPIKVYLRVSYGKKECNFGCVCNFYNDGWYENKAELWQAFHAFNEED